MSYTFDPLSHSPLYDLSIFFCDRGGDLTITLYVSVGDLVTLDVCLVGVYFYR